MTGTSLTARSMRSTSSAVDVGQAEVEQHGVRCLLHDHLDRGDAGGNRRHCMARVAEAVHESSANLCVVLHDEDAGHGPHGTSAVLGFPGGERL